MTPFQKLLSQIPFVKELIEKNAFLTEKIIDECRFSDVLLERKEKIIADLKLRIAKYEEHLKLLTNGTDRTTKGRNKKTQGGASKDSSKGTSRLGGKRKRKKNN